MFTDLILLVIVATSLWVFIDAKNIGVKKGVISGFFDMGPGGWFFSCLLLWVLAFPAYLVKREHYKKAVVAVSQPGSDIAEDIPAQIQKLAKLKSDGILTEEEFQAKKKELLSRM